MKKIHSRPYRILQDPMAVYRFMLEIYEKDWRNGVPAPFLEYALSSTWMDRSYTHLNRLWFDGDAIVGLVFYENPATDVYFSLRPGYEELAEEMVLYAEEHMPNFDGKQRLVLFGGQQAFLDVVNRRNYERVMDYWDCLYDFAKPLDYPLPEGFRIVPMGEADPAKACKCCWKGFDHEAEEGPWDGDTTAAALIECAPHQTEYLDVCIENEAGEYVCYAGMWWTPENRLAYMEPLCTIPECRKMGLAAAALSEMYRRTKALGATHMTGGGNPFYKKIGYEPMIHWNFFAKKRG